MINLKHIVAGCGIALGALALPAMADTAMVQTQKSTQPVTATDSTAPMASPQQQAQPGQTTRANGLQLQPHGGSGPDTSKFNVVSKGEAQKQQGAMPRSGGNSMTSDGTGGGENSSGN